ncbi:MAG: penicillin-binding protein, partial [Microbacteriaceae bacterium]|nr:penicillin-binding protein [Microbacteriaceae bacterium]
IVGMGSNTYGVESAANQYFSTTAKDVTLAQAASLIAIVQQPNLHNLSDPKFYPANKIRRDQILNAMYVEKYIDKKQLDEALATTIESEVHLSAPTSGCLHAIAAPLACDYVTKLITASPAASTPGLPPQLESLGATPAERKANWEIGGYKIYTSIDLDLQKTAEDQLAVQTPSTEDRFPLGATANSVEVGTGRVLVMAQNKVFDDSLEGAKDPTHSAVNFTTDFPYGGSNGFPTGSTYKVIDLANWLQTGHGLGDLVDGASGQNYKAASFTAPCDPGALADFGPLKNDSGGGGVMTVKNALIGSVNNAFMQMAERQDLCSIRDTAIAMGAHRADGQPLTVNPNSILGSNEQAPLTMAGVAATIGSGGLHCDAVIVDRVVDPAGKDLPGQTRTCNQALTSDIAAGTADAMVGSMTSGTSSPGNPRDGIQIGGKTGTSDVADHVWIIGTTTKVATSVWTGNILGHTSLRKMKNPITGSYYAGTSRFNIFKAIMTQADQMYGGDKFPAPSAAVIGGASSTVPNVTGQSPEQAKALLESLKYKYQDGGTVASALPAGKVVDTDPGAGTKTPTGATVTVFTSDGSLATTVPVTTGLTRQAADSALVAAGFSLANVTYTWLAGTPTTVCKVTASNPASGTATSKSSAVTLTVYGLAAVPANPNASHDPGLTVCPR